MDKIILGLLMLTNMTIYELNANFSKGLSMIYAASYGNLQYAVKKLLKNEMIYFEEKVENGRNKKIYHINESGVACFYKWMNEDVTTNNLETTILSKVYFLGLIEKKDHKDIIIDRMIFAVDAYIDELNNSSKGVDLTAIPEAYRDIASYQLSTLDYGMGVSQFSKTWLMGLKG